MSIIIRDDHNVIHRPFSNNFSQPRMFISFLIGLMFPMMMGGGMGGMGGYPIVIRQSSRRTTRKKAKLPKKYKAAMKWYRRTQPWRHGYFRNSPTDPAVLADRQLKMGKSWRGATDVQRQARRDANYYGKGDYRSWAKYIPRAIGGAVGGFMGRSLAGAQSGWDTGARFSRMIGLGDYNGGEPVANQIVAGSGRTPITVNASDDLTGDIYISHREFIQNISISGTINTTSAFQKTTFEINPGLQLTFPFLSQLAQNYTLYEFQGLIFEYVPTSGETGQNLSNALGKIIMATDYDPDSPTWSNAVSMMNYDYAGTCKPSERMIHGVETNPAQQSLRMNYIRTGPSSRDKIFTDIGQFVIATEGIPLGGTTTYQIGELWVTYRIKLSRAQLFNSNPSNIAVKHDSYLMVSDVPTVGNNYFVNAASSAWLATVGVGSTWATGPGANFALYDQTQNIGTELQVSLSTNWLITLVMPNGPVPTTYMVSIRTNILPDDSTGLETPPSSPASMVWALSTITGATSVNQTVPKMFGGNLTQTPQFLASSWVTATEVAGKAQTYVGIYNVTTPGATIAFRQTNFPIVAAANGGQFYTRVDVWPIYVP